MEVIDTIPLPPAPTPPPAAVPVVRRRRYQPFDRVAAGLVLAFAFLAGSFAARNADLWGHLAAGRHLALEHAEFGPELIAYSVERSVNSSWLFDLMAFSVFDQYGGPALVIGKALTVAAMALVLMRIRRSSSWWLAATITALVVLAVSPRLLLQPTVISLLFLAFTLRLLYNPDSRARWLLVPLFALWSNLDGWFLLGPATVLLFTLGRLDRRLIPVLLASTAACLLNPYHVHALRLPLEADPVFWRSGFPADPRFERFFLSPWDYEHYLKPGVGLSAAGIAYYVLFAVSVLSFALNRRALFSERGLLWTAFALLGAWQLRTVPFFAVVAGPITVLNLEDWAERVGSGSWRLAAVGKLFAFVGLLALPVLTWPGWLQAIPHEGRRVAWVVQPEPSLQAAAEEWARWRREGKVPEDRLFATHPDAAGYFAWFAPGTRVQFDTRPEFFPAAWDEHRTVTRALGKEPGTSLVNGLEPLRQSGVRYLALHDPDTNRVLAQLTGPASDAMPLLFVGGKTVLVGWRESQPLDKYDPVRELAFDPTRPAFGRASGPLELGPVQPPEPREWWQTYLHAPPPRSRESDVATVYARLFDESIRQRERLRAEVPLGVLAAGLAATGGDGSESIQPTANLLLRLRIAPLFVPLLDDGDPAWALLAVRSARQALAVNPEDANAWLRLGQAYGHLRYATRERVWAEGLKLLDVVRHVQTVTALEAAARLDPNARLAHELLAQLYERRVYLDAALDHRRAVTRIVRDGGPQPGEKPEAFDRRLKEAERAEQALEQFVIDRRNQYEIRSKDLTGNPLARARMLVDAGLAKQALDDVLLRSEAIGLGIDGARLQLELLLMLGRAARVRTEMTDEEFKTGKDRLGRIAIPTPLLPSYPGAYPLPSYEWLMALLEAGTGDAAAAERMLGAIDDTWRDSGEKEVGRTLLVGLAVEVGLGACPETVLVRRLYEQELESTERLLTGSSLLRVARADVHTLAGLLALERAAAADAEKHFREAQRLGRSEDDRVLPFAGRPITDAFLERIR